ncbi:uracil-xanthine permease family protein [Metaclostridioides mangenotii]|uniref:uracil-xanthine permease family protein n=1 Tax=Metaclostridioides mangenotii TaxID=1540 RepID=UPI000465C348|nr:nucleobase:cation symporter-2 family protein [Clostridioides mangenotii]
MEKNKVTNESVFDLEGKPPLLKCLPLSLQHILAMIVGTVAVPIVVGSAVGVPGDQITLLVQYALITAGVATLIQLYPLFGLGSGLPIIYGIGFTYVPTLVAVAKGYGIASIFGAQIVAGIVTISIGLCIKRIRKYFPNIVTGTVVFTIGLSLFPVGVNYIAGGTGNANYGSLANWALATFTLAVVIGLNQFSKGYAKLASLFLGIMIGYAVAFVFGMVDLSPIKEAGWVALPKPLAFGIQFDLPVVISVAIVSIVNAIQSIGDLSATTISGMDRDITGKELSRGVIGSGVATIFGSIFGGLPPSAYSQNVGIVAMNKVISKYVFAIAGIFMLLAGFIPKFGSLMTTIPYAVLGGATMSIFSMIMMTGMRLIFTQELSSRNTIIVGLAIALAMGITSVPEAQVLFPEFVQMVFGESPIVIAAIVAFTLNLIIPEKSLAQESKERAEMESGKKSKTKDLEKELNS